MEIKFRVWDSESKEMHVANKDSEVFISLIGVPYLSFDGDLFTSVDSNDLIAMQYTGFKDKLNADIYKGDILEVAGGSKIVVNNLPEFLIYCGKYEEKNGVELFPSVSVIGNVYENSDLI